MVLAIPTGAGNVTSASAGSANNITVSKPANLADGDLMVAAVLFRNSGGTVTAPAGWSPLGPVNTTNETFALFFKAVPTAASESATTYNFSTSAGSSRAAGIIARFPGVNLSGVVDAAGALAGYTGTTSVSLPAVSAVSGYTLLIGCAIANNSTTGSPSGFTAPAGMTEVGEVSADNGTSATATLWLGAQVLTAAGSTGTRAPTMSPSAANSGGLMVTVAGIPTAPPAATVVPDQLVSGSGWSAQPSGTIVAVLGDSAPATYAESQTLTGSNETLRVGFPELAASPGGVQVNLSLSLDVTAVTTTTVKLCQGATVLKSWSDIAPDSLQSFTRTASASDVAGVTDWAGLEVEITCHV